MTTGELSVLVWIEYYPERTYCNIYLPVPVFRCKIIFSLTNCRLTTKIILHRWVNIGKERDGMAPDAVQYARALRPPYHLLSFLRIKVRSISTRPGNETKCEVLQSRIYKALVENTY